MKPDSTALNVDLPDLPAADTEIIKDNVRAVAVLYFSAMLENLRFFQVVDSLVESFNNGLLPVGRGAAGDSLFKYRKNSQLRMSVVERHNVYRRVFGFSSGDSDRSVKPNKDFDDLWRRFISAVTASSGTGEVSSPANLEQVRKAGRDLAVNISLHGYGSAHFVAVELKKQIDDIVKILSAPEIKSAFGARDMWQLIDHISTVELGGSANVSRYRTMAQSGAAIIMWLANNAQKLVRTTPILNRKVARKAAPRSGLKLNSTPTDSDLINSCEQWLAVAAVPDEPIDSQR